MRLTGSPYLVNYNGVCRAAHGLTDNDNDDKVRYFRKYFIFTTNVKYN